MTKTTQVADEQAAFDALDDQFGKLDFVAPPRNQGQAVKRSYAAGEYIYCLTQDDSDWSGSIVAYEYPDDHAEHDFQPWNYVPQVGAEVYRIEWPSQL